MFHGETYCRACGYEWPSLMWMWHHLFGVSVLVQDQGSLALRVVNVPDDQSYYPPHETSEETAGRAVEAHVDAVVAAALRPGEQRVPLEEFVRLGGGRHYPHGFALPTLP